MEEIIVDADECLHIGRRHSSSVDALEPILNAGLMAVRATSRQAELYIQEGDFERFGDHTYSPYLSRVRLYMIQNVFPKTHAVCRGYFLIRRKLHNTND